MTVCAPSARLKTGTTDRTKKRIPIALQALRGGMRVLAKLAPEGATAVAERLFMTPRKRERSALERDALSRGTQLRLPTEHGDLAAWQWDPPEEPRDLVEPWRSPCDARPRVLLVHGWEGRGSQLTTFVEPLTAAGFRVVTFDAPAHGDSPGSLSSLFHFAHAIERAALSFGPFFAMVTHSMGGPSALWASRHGAIAERVVMIAPPNDVRDFTRSASRNIGLPEHLQRRLNLRLSERFGVPIENARAVRIAATMREPLLVVHDEDDRVVPVVCGEMLARAWPGAELITTRGLGHHRILRDGTTAREVVRFITAA